nr:SDR family oxidoreductase [Sphingomonas vulcanisoli]
MCNVSRNVYDSVSLVFGASGQIGAACAAVLENAAEPVLRISRSGGEGCTSYDPFGPNSRPLNAIVSAPLKTVVWAQGANANDSLEDFDADRSLELYKANCHYIAVTLHELLAADLIADGARLCIVSSVWQTVGRRNKLSYMMSKAAVQGLVLSASLDLAERDIMVNAVLPGALDTPMTHKNLSSAQIAQVKGSTPFNRLPRVEDVAATVAFLCSPANTSITGQFVAVDLGFRHARLV